MRFLLLLICAQLTASWSVGGELLLWRPIVYRPYAAVEGPPFTISQPGNTPWFDPALAKYIGILKPPYAPGFRVEAGYARCCWELRGRWANWTRVNSFARDISTDNWLWQAYLANTGFGLFFSPATFRRKDHFKVQIVDAEFDWFFPETLFCIPAHLYAGVRFTRLRYNVGFELSGLFFFSVTRDFATRWDSDLQATGPRIGAETCFPLFWGLGLSADFSAALLFGRLKGRYTDVKSSGLGEVSGWFSPANLIVTNAEARFGLTYDMGCFCGLQLSGAAGYEISFFSPAVIWTLFYGPNSNGDNDVDHSPFALDGFTFSITGRY